MAHAELTRPQAERRIRHRLRNSQRLQLGFAAAGLGIGIAGGLFAASHEPQDIIVPMTVDIGIAAIATGERSLARRNARNTIEIYASQHNKGLPQALQSSPIFRETLALDEEGALVENSELDDTAMEPHDKRLPAKAFAGQIALGVGPNAIIFTALTPEIQGITSTAGALATEVLFASVGIVLGATEVVDHQRLTRTYIRQLDNIDEA